MKSRVIRWGRIEPPTPLLIFLFQQLLSAKPNQTQSNTTDLICHTTPSIEYMDFCARVGVTHYPTLMVFGFDTYPDRDVISGLFLSKSTGEDKAVKYQADIYLSAVSTTPPHNAYVTT